VQRRIPRPIFMPSSVHYFVAGAKLSVSKLMP
jgi:hypothetical protein